MILILLIIISAISFWTIPNIPQETIETKNIWICYSIDGRINNVLVRSNFKPTFLPVSGNEEVDFYCNMPEIINFNPLSQ
jgi:hypothetical protein